MSSYSYTVAETTTFTLTHAKHIAAKVATDLKRIQRLYGSPTDSSIANYEAEIIQLLKAGYLDNVTYGFRRDGNWIEPTLRYTAKELSGGKGADDDPGKIRPGADISNATFYSYLAYSASWHQKTEAERDAFEKTLPFQRTGAPAPGVEGFLSEDRAYSAGGRSLNRTSVRSTL